MQAVIFFGAETWVITETTIQRLEGAHVSFLSQVTCKQATRRRDGSWRKVPAEAVLEGVGKQMLRTYVIGDRQQWRSGWPPGLFLICVNDIWGTRERY